MAVKVSDYRSGAGRPHGRIWPARLIARGPLRTDVDHTMAAIACPSLLQYQPRSPSKSIADRQARTTRGTP